MPLISIDALDGKSFQDEVLDLVKRNSMEAMSAEEILTWSVSNFHPRLTISASFGAPEGMVLIDMLHKVDPTTRATSLIARGARRSP